MEAGMETVGIGSRCRGQQGQEVHITTRREGIHRQRTRQQAGDEQLRCSNNRQLSAVYPQSISRPGGAPINQLDEELIVKMNVTSAAS